MLLDPLIHRPIRQVTDTVYAPQEDSRLLIEAMTRYVPEIVGARALDLCTGSGVIAIAAATLGASDVVAVDTNPAAVLATRENAEAAEVGVTAVHGSLTDALARGPYDVVLSNPPYVPAPTDTTDIAATAWDAGSDGRSVLDPLCDAMPDLLTAQGVAVIVQSETADVDETVRRLRGYGLTVDVVEQMAIPFGPVMAERAAWLSANGMLPRDAQTELLSVIRASR